MSRNLGWLRQFHKPTTPGLPALITFPHAGAGASSYRSFSKVASSSFDVAVVQYPGRQDRVRDRAADTLPQLAAGAFEEFATSRFRDSGPVTVFGHSMGAIVAFEFTRLAEAAGVQVRLLTVSAAVAPGRVAALPPHPTEDQELLDHMVALEGTGGDVLASREVMALALPVMKMDYRAFDAYSCPDDVTVATDIHALGGVDDPFVPIGELHGWSRHSRAASRVTVFDGGHFYLDQHATGIAELLV